jgi:HEAT repeat protein
MRELRRNTRVKLVDIRESCSLPDLKRGGFERAERYKNISQLDMILHTFSDNLWEAGYLYYFSLIDLYTKKVKEVSIETTRGMSVELGLRGISRKILVSQDLNQVLRAKKKVLGKKEVAVAPEVKEIPKREVMESPQEIEDFLIQKGPKLIAEDEYDRVLELIDDLPRRRSRHVQIQTLECFANLKGWVSDRDQSCKSRWWNVRERLINLGDNEATPMLLIFLKDEDPWMRIYAAELLGHIGDKRALKDLRAAGENDENRKVRKYAKKAYEQIFGEKF